VHTENAHLHKVIAGGTYIAKGIKKDYSRNRRTLCLPVSWQAVAATEEVRGRSETQE
jgi:hypothetical protein